jgi:hypothetical protein
MTPLWLTSIPQPDPLAQPAPGWLLWGLLLLTFFLHVLPMNFVLGGSIMTLVARWRSRGDASVHAGTLARWMAKAMPVAIAAAVTFGVAPLLFLQALFGRLFFTSSILMAGFWLAVVPLLIAAYYAAYTVSFASDRRRSWIGPLSWLMTIAFLAVGFVYVNNMSLMLQPDRFVELYRADGRGLHLNLDDPTLVPRYLHMVLGSIAVAGVAVAVHGWVSSDRAPAFGSWAMRHGASWCAGATALNLVVGFWWLLAVPRPALTVLVTRVPVVALFLGIAVGMVVLTLAVMVSRTVDPVPHVKWLLAGTLVTLVLMIITRDQVRSAALADAGFTPATWIEPQWGAIAVFGMLLLAALVTIGWMIGALRQRADEP